LVWESEGADAPSSAKLRAPLKRKTKPAAVLLRRRWLSGGQRASESAARLFWAMSEPALSTGKGGAVPAAVAKLEARMAPRPKTLAFK
jgi:hypothetical protein